MVNKKRLIDVDLYACALAKEVNRLRKKYEGNSFIQKVIGLIDDARTFALQQPIVDAVEVVRCKDCKFAYINNFAKVQEKALCNLWRNHDGNSVLLQADDFCSYGERRTDG